MNNVLRMGMRHLPRALAAFGVAMNAPQAWCEADKKANQVYIGNHIKTPERLTYQNDGVEFNQARVIVSQAKDIRAKLKGPYEEYSGIHRQAIQSPLQVNLKAAEKLFTSLSSTFEEMDQLIRSRGELTEKTGLKDEFDQIKNDYRNMYSDVQDFRTEILQRVPLEQLKKYHSELTKLKNKLELAVMMQNPEIAEKRAAEYVEQVKEAFAQLAPMVESPKTEASQKVANAEEIDGLLEEIGKLKGKTPQEIKAEGKLERTEELDRELIEWCSSHIDYASEVDSFINYLLIPAGLNKGIFAEDWENLRTLLKERKPQKPFKLDTFDSLKMIEQAVNKIDAKALLEGRVSQAEIEEMAKTLQVAKLETGIEYLTSIIKEKGGKGFSFTELHSQMRENIGKVKELYRTAYENIGVIISGSEQEKINKRKLKDERVELLSDILFEVNSIESVLDLGVEEAKREQVFVDIEKMRQELYALSNDYNKSTDNSVDGKPSKELLGRLSKAHKELETKVEKEAILAIKQTSEGKIKEYRERVVKETFHLLTDIAPRLSKDSQEPGKKIENQRTWFGAIGAGLRYAGMATVATAAIAGIAQLYKAR